MSAAQVPRKEDVLYMTVPELRQLLRTRKISCKELTLFGQVDEPLGALGNLLGWPALSVPCGFVNNLPIGMLILGAYGRDDDVSSVGIDYQKSSDWHKRRPPV